jgi:hypothetical protein
MKTVLPLLLLLMAGCDQFHPAPTAQTYAPPKYQIIAVAGENQSVWKLDTQTGDVWQCVSPPFQQQPLCYKAKMQ